MKTMRKKEFLLIILILSAFIIFANQSIVSAQEGIAQTAGDIKNTINTLGNEEARNTYLAEEWTKIIRDNPKLQWIYGINPVFKFLIGYEFSLSWAFVIALLLWVIMFSVYYPAVQELFKGVFTSLGISIILAMFSAKFISPKVIEGLTSIIKNIWGNLLIIILLIFLILFIRILSKQIKNGLKENRKKKKIENLEEETEKEKLLREKFESIEKGAKSMKKGSKS